METEIIDGLVDRWEEMQHNGTPLTVDELCVGHPGLAAEVRRRIEALRAMDSALETEVSGRAPADSRHALAARVTSEVLRITAAYRPRRLHDKGGLGIVLAADEPGLGRMVALKQIRPDRLHDAARRRFLREAALTAQLQHPGIVPIYGLGEAGGVPYYTMRFVRGRTLREAIAEFHAHAPAGRDPGERALEFRGLLQHFVAACNTVAYAHDEGVVHRDLKPSNIMLGSYGETLVMDWGLAKRFAAGEEDESDGGRPPAPRPTRRPRR